MPKVKADVFMEKGDRFEFPDRVSDAMYLSNADGYPRVTFYFFGIEDMLPHIEQLRDACQAKIDQINAARADIAAKASDKIDELRAKREAESVQTGQAQASEPEGAQL